MSKLDFVTVAIVTICIAALVFLIVKTTSLLKQKDTGTTDLTEATTGDSEDSSEDSSTYTYDDEGEIIDDNTGDGSSSEIADEDLDDARVDPLDEDELDPDPNVNEPENIPDSQDRTATSDYSNTGGAYLVIAGSFKVKENAEGQVSKLKTLGYNDATTGMFNRGAFASVIVDRFNDQTSARRIVKELRDEHGIESYVHHKKN